MNLNFVARKKYRSDEVQELLTISENEQKFTNNGPVKRLLEKELKSFLKLPENKSVVCLSNGTTSLHALLYVYEIISGKSLKWLTSSFTFPTPVVAGFSASIAPVDETGQIEKNVSLDEVDGLIITSVFGATAGIEYWQNRCAQEGKILILDNASSPCSAVNGKNIMSYGSASFSSLHHTKFLGVGEGGFVVVDSEIRDLVNKVACFGFDDERNYDHRSSNFKMSDVTAAYILSHIRNYDFGKHLENQDILVNFLQSMNITTLGYDLGVVFGNLPVLFNREIKKTEFAHLGVEVNKYYRPLDRDPNAWKIYDRIINFPLNDSLCIQDIEKIKSAILKVSNNG